MSGYIQVSVLFLVFFHLDISRAKPFGEFAFRRNIDFAFKPLPLKPLAFITEKWGPFGVFGKKHGIAKRDLDNIAPMDKVSVPPMVTVKVPLEKAMTRLPAEVYEAPVETVSAPPLVPVPVTPIVYGPIPAPPLGPVVITPPLKPKEPVEGLHTDIYRDELFNAYLKEIEKPIEKPILPQEKVLPPVDNSIIEKKVEGPPLPKDEPNPIVRGSRLALYFGNILLDILSQFLGGPKLEKLVAV